MFSLRNKRNASRHTNISSSTLGLPEPDDRLTENVGKILDSKKYELLLSSSLHYK